MLCKGRNQKDHCCWLDGKVCQYLEENTEPEFRWSCGLYRELGSWDAVEADPRYQEHLVPFFEERAVRLNKPMMSCREYPTPEDPCMQCMGHEVNT